MRAIILAAGQGFKLDGCNKLLLKDPKSGERIIDQYLRFFNHMDITVVVGYKAIEVVQIHPNLNYVYNSNWQITNNSYSLSLALDENPCFVLSGDLFLDENLIDAMADGAPNCLLTEKRENRELNSLNCILNEHQEIKELYQGPRRHKEDPEAMGIYKICNRDILRIWKKNCLEHPNLFCGQNLRFDISPISSFDIGSLRLDEVNTVLDYLRIINNK